MNDKDDQEQQSDNADKTNSHDNDLPMSNGQRLCLKIVKHSNDTIIVEFFSKLLNGSGSIRHLYSGRRLHANAFLKYYMFLIMLERAESILLENGTAFDELCQLLHRHYIYGMKPEHIQVFSNCMLWTIRHLLKNNFTQADIKLFTILMNRISSIYSKIYNKQETRKNENDMLLESHIHNKSTTATKSKANLNENDIQQDFQMQHNKDGMPSMSETLFLLRKRTVSFQVANSRVSFDQAMSSNKEVRMQALMTNLLPNTRTDLSEEDDAKSNEKNNSNHLRLSMPDISLQQTIKHKKVLKPTVLRSVSAANHSCSTATSQSATNDPMQEISFEADSPSREYSSESDNTVGSNVPLNNDNLIVSGKYESIKEEANDLRTLSNIENSGNNKLSNDSKSRVRSMSSFLRNQQRSRSTTTSLNTLQKKRKKQQRYSEEIRQTFQAILNIDSVQKAAQNRAKVDHFEGLLLAARTHDATMDRFIWAFLITTFFKLQQAVDAISDIILIANLFQSSITLAIIMLIYVMLPYLVLTFLLYDRYKQEFDRKYPFFRSSHSTMVLLLYCIFAIPCFVCLDWYIYTIKLFSNLAATRFLYQYFRLRSFLEALCESLPQTISIAILVFSENNVVVEPWLLSLAFVTSSLSIIIHISAIWYSGRRSGEGFWGYFWNHLVRNESLPWADAILFNQITQLKITQNDYMFFEWMDILKLLQANESIQNLYVNQTLGREVSLLLFRAVSSNNLTVLHLPNCKIFQPTSNFQQLLHTHAQDRRKKQRSQSLAFVQPNDPFNIPPKMIDKKNLELTVEHSSSTNSLCESNSKGKRVSLPTNFLSQSQKDSSYLTPEEDQFNIDTDQVAIELGILLERNADLEQLNLANNKLGFHSLYAIASITTLKRLQYLDLSNNNLSVSTCGVQLAYWLTNIFRQCLLIHTVILDNNGIMDDEVISMAKYIRKKRINRRLKLLSLLHCPVTQISVQVLSSMRMRRSIQNVRLNNDFGVVYHWTPWREFKHAFHGC